MISGKSSSVWISESWYKEIHHNHLPGCCGTTPSQALPPAKCLASPSPVLQKMWLKALMTQNPWDGKISCPKTAGPDTSRSLLLIYPLHHNGLLHLGLTLISLWFARDLAVFDVYVIHCAGNTVGGPSAGFHQSRQRSLRDAENQGFSKLSNIASRYPKGCRNFEHEDLVHIMRKKKKNASVRSWRYCNSASRGLLETKWAAKVMSIAQLQEDVPLFSASTLIPLSSLSVLTAGSSGRTLALYRQHSLWLTSSGNPELYMWTSIRLGLMDYSRAPISTVSPSLHLGFQDLVLILGTLVC